MATLHIVGTSPTHPNHAALALALQDGDTLIFLQDGAYYAQNARALAELKVELKVKDICFLADDLLIRGIASTLNKVDYSGFVALTASLPRSVSWF